MRPRSKGGKLDKLISKVTNSNQIKEFAKILGVTVRVCYRWDQGHRPTPYYQDRINKLCESVGFEPLYDLRERRVKVRGGQIVTL